MNITNRQEHKLKPNTQEWIEYRYEYFNASEAPAMLGCCPNVKRNELLKLKHTRTKEAISYFQQKIYDKGHENEAIARPWAEEILKTDLFQKILSADVDNIPLSASYDGLCLFDEQSFEHKQLNKQNIEDHHNGIIAKYYCVQMEQQLMISGAETVLFMISDGIKSEMLCQVYESNPELRIEIIDGWKQFKHDLDNYVVKAVVVAPVVDDIKSLPALNVKIHGGITASNIDVFKKGANQFISNINTNLTTDKDFLTAEKTVKFLKDTRIIIKQVKKAALSQTADIEMIFNELDLLDSQFQVQSSKLDKLVKAEKENKKIALCNAAAANLREYVLNVNHKLKRPCIAITVDFRVIIKGKRTISSIENAIDTALAQAKIDVTKREKIIGVNLDYYRSVVGDYENLFLDLNQLFDKEPDTFSYLIDERLKEYKEKESIRLENERAIIKKDLEDKAAQKIIDDKVLADKRKKDADQKIIDDKNRIEKDKKLGKTLTEKVENMSIRATGNAQNSLNVDTKTITNNAVSTTFPSQIRKKPTMEMIANHISVKFCHQHGLLPDAISDLTVLIEQGYKDLMK